ncbi:MAG TPA: YraN family protein [Acidobacteriaceae bacterium]|nr:YraN family protein [Acidobacteriaceae bacterium]
MVLNTATPNRGSRTLNTQQLLLRAIDTITKKLGRTPVTAPHLETGSRGEEAALFHLRRSGYTIIARQWRSMKLRGDIDLIGWDGGTLCFIEVKTRTSRDFGPAEFAVDEEKQRMLRRMARAYLRRCDNADDLDVRFDIVSVYLSDTEAEFEILKDWFAFS